MQEEESTASSRKECNEIKENLLLSNEKVVVVVSCTTVQCMHVFTYN